MVVVVVVVVGRTPARWQRSINFYLGSVTLSRRHITSASVQSRWEAEIYLESYTCRLKTKSIEGCWTILLPSLCIKEYQRVHVARKVPVIRSGTHPGFTIHDTKKDGKSLYLLRFHNGIPRRLYWVNGMQKRIRPVGRDAPQQGIALEPKS